MKKIYLAPETIVVEMAIDAIMNITSVETTEASGDMKGMSRESDWDE